VGGDADHRQEEKKKQVFRRREEEAKRKKRRDGKNHQPLSTTYRSQTTMAKTINRSQRLTALKRRWRKPSTALSLTVKATAILDTGTLRRGGVFTKTARPLGA
jgi:hypothetical protein